jgi:hypothetical protein
VDGRVIFRDSVVDKFFDWFDVTNADKADLDLSFLKVGKFRDDTNSWPKAGHLHLDGFAYDLIESADDTNLSNQAKVFNRIRWFDLQPTNEFHPQPFQQFASVLRSDGLVDEANTVMIQENDRQSEFIPFWSLSGLSHFSFGILLNYGYRLTPAIAASLVLILLGWIFAALGFNKRFSVPKALREVVSGSEYSVHGNLFSPTDTDAAYRGDNYNAKSYPKFNAFIYSLETFLPLVKLGVSDYWHINDAATAQGTRAGHKKHFTFGQWLRFYFWIHIIAGWILTTLMLGVLTGLIKN